MAVAELTDTLRDISLHDNALLFSPNAHARWSNLTLEHVPRFLFRVYTPRSDGFTDETVASSRDASLGVEGSNEDVFATQTPAVTAKLIADHLLWTPGHRKDNLVSWSSSMLFLIRYIFYKHYNINDRSHIRDIQLLVVDTEKFQARTFIRDLDLISAFRRFNIQAFHSLSNWRTTDKYFGEYLSQGSLDIEGKCSIVSAQTMISSGLLDLHIDFKHANEGRDSDKWAKSVLQIRDTITAARHKQPVSLDVLDKAYQVAMEFGAPWSLPIAISLMALIPHALERREAYDRLWIRLRPTDHEFDRCATYWQELHAPQTMSELTRGQSIMERLVVTHVENILLQAVNSLAGKMRISTQSSGQYSIVAVTLQRVIDSLFVEHDRLEEVVE